MAQWQKRKTMPLPCPSGELPIVQRPGPELSLKAGRLAPVFGSKPTGADAETIMQELSDEESAKIYLFARQVIVDVVVEPKITLDGKDESLTPEDIPPSDFWHIFSWFMRGCPDISVPLKEGETTVEAVETFPVEPLGDVIAGSNGEQVSQATV